MVNPLAPTRKEKLNNETSIYQVESGTTIYYSSFKSPHRLYARFQGKEFNAKLPFADMQCIGAFGNAAYMRCNHGKIYKAAFDSTNGFTVTFLRDITKYESVHSAGVCSLLQDRQTYYYRISDDPVQDRINVGNLPESGSTLQYLSRVHRGKVVYFSYNVTQPYPSVRRINDNVIAVEVPDIPKASYAPSDECPFIYYACDSKLFAFDTETMKVLQPLRIAGVTKITSIAGLHNGEITVRCVSDGRTALVATKLPRDYLTSSKPTVQQTLSKPTTSSKPTTPNRFLYIDPFGVERGPYPEEKMDSWYNAGHFKKSDLKVRRENDRNFTMLSELLKINGRTPFKYTERTVAALDVRAAAIERELESSSASTSAQTSRPNTISSNEELLARWRLDEQPRRSDVEKEKLRTSEMREQTPSHHSPTVPIEDSLDDTCACSLCIETFDPIRHTPRVLDCGHTFCEVCVYNKHMCIKDKVKCPHCGKDTNLPGERQLPINYALLSMADQATRSKADPKVTCKACNASFASSAVRRCTKKDCSMFNQLICLSCVVDDGHGSHGVVKYGADVQMDKIREQLHADMAQLSSDMEDKKRSVLRTSKEIIKAIVALEINLSDAKIPSSMFKEVESLTSEQDANLHRENVSKMARTVTNECDTLAEAVKVFLNSTSDLSILQKKSNEDLKEERSAFRR